MREPFQIGDISVNPGERKTLEIPVPSLYTHTELELPVHVIHSNKPGPVLFLSAAVHGDEINGVEIIRRTINNKTVNKIKGTLVAVPVVNIYGFINQTRYLPDRRDLNRSFPGSEKGSLAARMANLFLSEIVSKCTHGIDLHTAAIHRENLPHVRAFLDDEQTEMMARAFISPLIINTDIVEGSLRAAVEKMGISVIVYEAGEALRFNEVAIRAGVKGVISVMRELGMLPKLKRRPKKQIDSIIAGSSAWVRASQSGIIRMITPLGAIVEKNQVLGIIADPFGDQEEEVRATISGIVVGRTNIPLVHEGEALFHIAQIKKADVLQGALEVFKNEMDPDTDIKTPIEPPIV